MGKEVVMAYPEYSPGIFMGMLRNNMKYLVGRDVSWLNFK
jgi:hypothetical protein